MTRCDLRVGVIGLGALGLPMAANLRRADVPLRVHTRSRWAKAIAVAGAIVEQSTTTLPAAS